MKISVITAARNAAATIGDTLESVRGQRYGSVEHVVVDGASSDGTFDVVKSGIRDGGRAVSERDAGIYDAFNKGFRLSSGDVIAYLGADDSYASPDVLGKVVARLEETGADAVFGDAAFVRPPQMMTFARRYRSGVFKPGLVRWGFMPAHSALFVRRRLMEQFGVFDPTYQIAADFELIARLFVSGQASFSHIPEVLTIMRVGGVSSSGLLSTQTISREILRACRENHIYSNWLMVRMRYLWKLLEFVAPGRRGPLGPSAGGSDVAV